MRGDPQPETLYSAGSSLLLPVSTGAQGCFMPSLIQARSPGSTGDRVGCLKGTWATGQEMSLTEEQREVGERAEI